MRLLLLIAFFLDMVDSLEVAGAVEVKREKNAPMLSKVSIRRDPEEIRREFENQALFGSVIDDQECLAM